VVQAWLQQQEPSQEQQQKAQPVRRLLLVNRLNRSAITALVGALQAALAARFNGVLTR
jgi:hypothetical protein